MRIKKSYTFIQTVGLFVFTVQNLESQKPNVVFILVDDLGWHEPGCCGSPFNKTPNIDKLAKSGMRFTQAYSAGPVSSPTRASLMTGQCVRAHGITNYLENNDSLFLDTKESTSLAEAFALNNYTTGLIGKWHLTGNYFSNPGAPDLHGFQEIILSEKKYIGGGDYFFPVSFLPDVKAKDGEYLVDRMNAEAVDFIERNKHQPFFLELSHYAVHTYLDAPQQWVEKYKQKPGSGQKENNPVLAAMLERIDDGVGMIVNVLEKSNLLENTIIIFTSDNGGAGNVTNNAPLRGAKGALYEGGIRVPLIISWKGKIPAGTINPTQVITYDFFPTLVSLCELNVSPVQEIQGINFSKALLQSQLITRDNMFWYHTWVSSKSMITTTKSAIRMNDWKLIWFQHDNYELYNLKDDPEEKYNRINDSNFVSELMKEKLSNLISKY